MVQKPPWKEGAESLSPAHARPCMHAHTHQRTCGGTGRPMDSTDTVTQMQGPTETRLAVPLPYLEEEPWTQTLASPPHRDTNTCIHTALRCVVQKTRKKRFSRLAVPGKLQIWVGWGARLSCSHFPIFCPGSSL